MKILVTGAAGFIGSHMAEKLAVAGHEVIGLDCFTDYYARQLKQLNADDAISYGVNFLNLDLTKDDLSGAVRGVEAVYHFAAQPGISSDVSLEDYVRNNIIATNRLLESLDGSKTLKILVNIATSSIYGADATDSEEASPKPTSYYGVTKLAAEQLVLASYREKNLPACSLRIFSVYGERERPEKLFPKLIGCILDDKTFPLFEGSEDHQRSFTYVGDITNAAAAVLDKIDNCVGEIINFGSDKSFTTGQAIKIIEQIIGQKARFDRKPKRPGDQLKTHANIEKAKKLLGYTPKTTLKDGLTAEVNWYKDKMRPLKNYRQNR